MYLDTMYLGTVVRTSPKIKLICKQNSTQINFVARKHQSYNAHTVYTMTNICTCTAKYST